MKRSALLVVLLLSIGLSLPVSAQDHNAEFFVGADFALNSQEFDVEQTLGFDIRGTWQFSERFGVGLVYETTSSMDDLGFDGDAEWSIFGLTGQAYLNDEEQFQILVVAGLGTGDLEYMNPNAPGPLPDDVDLSLWYELGGAANFVLGDRWMIRAQITGRRIEPDEPSTLLQSAKTLIVPSVRFGVKF